jgi:hypothetical protein
MSAAETGNIEAADEIANVVNSSPLLSKTAVLDVLSGERRATNEGSRCSSHT